MQSLEKVIQYLKDFNQLEMNQYFKNDIYFSIIMIGIQIGTLLLFYIFVWRNYINYLVDNIQRNRGMLKMIPLQAIKGNERLKLALLKGDLMNQVG